MARMPTIVVPGVPLHVTQLRAASQSLFVDPQDYANFLLDLGEGAAVFGCAVHAYALVPGQIHLLLTPAERDGPSRLMRALGRRHEHHRSRRRAPAGQPFATNFHSIPVYSDRDVLARSRQIELTPVYAKMASEPVAFRWSSYRCNGLGARDAILTPHASYLALGSTSVDRQCAYRALFYVEPTPGWCSTLAGRVLNGPPSSRAEAAQGR
jgi:putative transposase